MVLVVPLVLVLAAVAVARGGGRPRPALLIAALVAAAAAAVAAGLGADDDAAVAVAWSAVPVALVAGDLAASRSAMAPAVHAGVVVGTAVFVLVTGFSIGLLFVPTLLVLAVAGFGSRETAYVRR